MYVQINNLRSLYFYIIIANNKYVKTFFISKFYGNIQRESYNAMSQCWIYLLIVGFLNNNISKVFRYKII